jgi:hypothetical protein
MNKILLPIFAAAALGAGAFGVYQMNLAGERQSDLTALQGRLTQLEQDRAAERAKLLAELEALKENVARLSRERDAAKAKSKEVAANGEGNAETSAGGKKAGSEFKGLMESFAKRMDDPEVRKAMKSGLDRAVETFYGPMFKTLGLDEASSKLAMELISERNMAAFDKGRKIMSSGGGEAAMAEARKEVEAVKADYDSKLKSVLGDQGFGQFTSHEQTVGDQRALTSFTRSFEQSGTPLQPQQRDALFEIMRAERLKNPSNEIPDLGGGPGMAMLMSDEELKARQQQEQTYEQNVLRQAPQAGLSPDQVNVLQSSFKRRNDQQANSRIMGRLFLGGGR